MAEYVDFKAGKEIEWMEINLLKNGTSLSKSQISNLSSEGDESTIDSWISELEIRMNLYGEPLYEIENNLITPLKNYREVPEYFLCLYYSYYGANDYSGGTKLFELISANVLKNFIDGDVYTLGHPTTMSFNDYLDSISTTCNEVRNLRARATYKDDGVDVLGYKLFGDGRSSNLYVLLQCAAGRHWTQKKQIVMNRWTNYLIWFPENIIQSISTVEYVKSSDWDKQSSTFGMLIDRVRIYNFLFKTEIDNQLRTDTLDWCNAKLAAGV